MEPADTDTAIMRQRLRHLCQDGGRIDLAEAGLLLAALWHPGIDLDPYRQHLASMAADALKLEDQAPDQALRQIVAEANGYAGDSANYDDLQNADLIRVIDRRKGLPVSLGIVFLSVARACGWEAVGLSFPSHFLIRIGSGPGQAIVDPFHGGQALTPEKLRALRKSVAGAKAELALDQFAAVEDVEVLMRLQNNIKSRLLGKRDGEGALAVLDSMLLVAPDRPELWYETGMINAAMEKNGAAIRALERCLRQAADAGHRCGLGQGARSRAEETLHRLKRRLN